MNQLDRLIQEGRLLAELLERKAEREARKAAGPMLTAEDKERYARHCAARRKSGRGRKNNR